MQTRTKPSVNPRQLRGRELAQKVRIQPVGKGVRGRYIVPSATSSAKYTVDLNSNKNRCSCPDWELRRCKCKHIFAVEYSVRKQIETATDSDGQTVVTETVTKTKRTTYSQNWPAYNTAQTTEKKMFQVLLHDLCKPITDSEQVRGRARLPLPDMIFCATFKVYATLSARRFTCDLEEAHNKGYISKVPHFNSVLNCLDNAEVTPILHAMIRRSSLPLKAVETDFAVDSSGFSGSKSGKWYYEKFNGDKQDFTEVRERTDWLKMHLMCGVKTNIVTSVEMSGRHDNDYNYLAPLVDDTAERFTLKEVSADKAYLGRSNLHAIAKHKAIPFIPFKVDSNGGAVVRGEKHSSRGDELWLNMWRFYTYHTDQFMEHYHKRSNVETTFSMIKGKFGENLRSKSLTARTNEALCKVLCHNLCCVIQSIHELGIEATFCAETPVAQKIPC